MSAGHLLTSKWIVGFSNPSKEVTTVEFKNAKTVECIARPSEKQNGRRHLNMKPWSDYRTAEEGLIVTSDHVIHCRK